MLTSDAIKDFARNELSVDIIGVGNIERWQDAPPDMSPTTMMPRARSVIVFGKRILRGCYRGIDQGTHWPSYQVFGYGGLNHMLGQTCYRLGRFIESHGFEAVPVSTSATLREFGPRAPNPKPGLPPREVTMQLRIAATLAGVGEIGWSKVLLTKEHGPRQRICGILTDAELEPDPMVVGELCDRCKRCVKECPGGAIKKHESVSIEVEGKKIEWNDLDLGKCKLTHFGLNRKSAPHLVKHFPGLYLPVGEQEVTWLEAWNLGWAIFPQVPLYKALSSFPVPICGARGCIIGCMKHMEKRGRVENTFSSKPGFSDQEPWELPERPEHRDHHGFVYDPEYGTPEDGEGKFAPPPDWY